MSVPYWVLSIAYWLHMLSTVVWIGSLVGLSIFVLPIANKTLDRNNYALFMERAQRRLDPLSWFCLIVLVVTGLIQMSANPNYRGFLAIEDRWAISILFKHLLFLGMVGLSAYLTWVVIPKLRRIGIHMSRISDEEERDQLILKSLHWQRQEVVLIRLNLFLGIVILALTSLARSA